MNRTAIHIDFLIQKEVDFKIDQGKRIRCTIPVDVYMREAMDVIDRTDFLPVLISSGQHFREIAEKRKFLIERVARMAIDGLMPEIRRALRECIEANDLKDGYTKEQLETGRL